MFDYGNIISRISNTLIPNKWRHFGLVLEKSSKLRIYIDGNKIPNKTLKRLFGFGRSITCWFKKPYIDNLKIRKNNV